MQRATERASLIVTFFAPPKVKVQQRQYVRQDVAAIPKKQTYKKQAVKMVYPKISILWLYQKQGY